MKTIEVTISEVSFVGQYLVLTGFKKKEEWTLDENEILPEVKLALDTTDKDTRKTIEYLLRTNYIPAKDSMWKRLKLLAGRDIRIYDTYIVTGEEEIEQMKSKNKRK